MIQPFAVEGVDVRGRLVRLGGLVDDVLRRHAYPEPVSAILGEAMVLAAMLGSALKFKGTFTLQTRSDGPVRMLVADYVTPQDPDEPGLMRGYASFDQERVANVATTPRNVQSLMGAGHFALTVDRGPAADRYQGIVSLEGDSLADCAYKYLRESEQIPTSIKVAVALAYTRADGGGAQSWRAGGVMIQHLPKGGPLPIEVADNREAWNRTRILLETVEDHELIDPMIGPDRLLFRLFHEDGVRAFRPQPVAFGCRCTRERVYNVLQRYPRSTLEELTEDGYIIANCEFCNEIYRFTPDEVKGSV